MSVLKVWNGSEWIEFGASITDHGNLTGLTDDDHIIYSRINGARDFTSTVGGVDPVASSDLTTKNYSDAQDATVSGHLQGEINDIKFIDLDDTPNDYIGPAVVGSGSSAFVIASSGTEQLEYTRGNLQLEEVGRVTYSGAASVEFVDVFDLTSNYLLRFKDHEGTFLSTTELRFSSDNGATWISTASYFWKFWKRNAGDTVISAEAGVSSDDNINLFSFNTSAHDLIGPTRPVNADMKIFGMGSSNYEVGIQSAGLIAGVWSWNNTVGGFNEPPTVFNGIQISEPSALMVGEMILYRII